AGDDHRDRRARCRRCECVAVAIVAVDRARLVRHRRGCVGVAVAVAVSVAVSVAGAVAVVVGFHGGGAMTFADRGTHRIHYEILGDDGAPPVLLVMGMAFSSRAWDTLPGRLASE